LNKIFHSNILEHLFKMIFYFHVFIPFLVLFRQVGNLWIGHIWKFVSVYALILLFLHIIKYKKVKTIKIDSLFLILVSCFILGNIVAIFNNNFSFYSYKSHIFTIVFWIAIYIAYKEEIIIKENLESFISKVSVLLVTTYGICLLLVYTYFLRQGNFYLGFSSTPLLIPFIYYMIHKRYFLLLFTIILIFISGKRGVFIILPIIGIVYLYFVMNIRAFLIVIVKILLFVLLVGIFIYYSNVYLLFESSINKFNLILDALKSDELNLHSLAIMSSGRTIEIIQGINELTKYDSWLYGLGYGFKIVVSSVDGSYFLTNHYVHMSFFNFILLYGLPLSFVFLIVFSYKVLRKLYRLKQRTDLEQFFIMLTIGFLLVGLTNYSMSFNPMIWIVLIFGIYGFKNSKGKVCVE